MKYKKKDNKKERRIVIVGNYPADGSNEDKQRWIAESRPCIFDQEKHLKNWDY